MGLIVSDYELFIKPGIYRETRFRNLLQRSTELFVIGTWHVVDVRTSEARRAIERNRVIQEVLNVLRRVPARVIICDVDATPPEVRSLLEYNYLIPVVPVEYHHAKYVISDAGIYVGSANLSWAGLMLNTESGFVDVGYGCSFLKDFYVRLIDEVITYIERGVYDKDVRRGSGYYVDRVLTILREVLEDLFRLRNQLMAGAHSSSTPTEHDPDPPEDLCLRALRGLSTVQAILLAIPAKETPESARKFIDNLSKIRKELEQACVELSEIELDYQIIIDKLEYVIHSISTVLKNERELERIVNELLGQVDSDVAASLFKTLVRTRFSLRRLQEKIRGLE